MLFIQVKFHLPRKFDVGKWQFTVVKCCTAKKCCTLALDDLLAGAGEHVVVGLVVKVHQGQLAETLPNSVGQPAQKTPISFTTSNFLVSTLKPLPVGVLHNKWNVWIRKQSAIAEKSAKKQMVGINHFTRMLKKQLYPARLSSSKRYVDALLTQEHAAPQAEALVWQHLPERVDISAHQTCDHIVELVILSTRFETVIVSELNASVKFCYIRWLMSRIVSLCINVSQSAKHYHFKR